MDSKRITKKDLINQIFKKIDKKKISGEQVGRLSFITQSDLHTLIGLIEETVYDNLKMATEKESITIAFFEGMNIESSYIPQKTKINNLTGKSILTTSKIKPKATFTRTCCEKLSENVR